MRRFPRRPKRYGGAGVGYNFSALRPSGAIVSGTGGRASGPLAYMDIFERSCTTLEAVDARRGAQMAVLNIEHPDIVDFVDAKRVRGRFTSFNLSVGVSDTFMHGLAADGDFELVPEWREINNQVVRGGEIVGRARTVTGEGGLSDSGSKELYKVGGA